MKKIILLDRSAKLAYNLAGDENYLIRVLVVDRKEQVEELKNYKNIEQIFYCSAAENDDWSETFDGKLHRDYYEYDSDLISKFKRSHNKIDSFIARFTSDWYIRQAYYYNALFYWNYVFRTLDIDEVILNDLQHGTSYDLALDYAKIHGIRPIIIETLTSGKSNRLKAFFDYSKKQYIEIPAELRINSAKSIKNFLNEFSVPYKYEHQNASNTINFIVNNLYSLFGPVIFFLKPTLKRTFLVQYSQKIPYWKLATQLLKMKHLLRYYERYSVKPNFKESYIYFPLHFQPEASISVNTSINDQLTLIKMLSNVTDKKTKIFIKEHPVYQKIGEPKFHYHLAAVCDYRSKWFYDELSKLENVVLIDLEANQSELIKNAKAVAVINGSVLFEALFLHSVPVISFSPASNPLTQKCDHVIRVNSYEECRKALETIKRVMHLDKTHLQNLSQTFICEESKVSAVYQSLRE